jgi:polysaccharide export outer membrane protein
MRLPLFFVILPALLLSACASPVRNLADLPPDQDTPYVLGAGDTLQVVVFGEPDLSGTVHISDSGQVAMPLIGTITAQGLTLNQLQQQLVKKLDANAVRSPNVTVTISEYRPFFILGEVKNPGSYPYMPHMTVLTAIAIAGGFTPRASQDAISVTRHYNGKPYELKAPRKARVQPGDTVYVFERHF